MTIAQTPPAQPSSAQTPPVLSLPDHTQLPETDGTFVKNVQEHPQSILLTTSLTPVLDALHPDGQYAIGQDCGIYWRLTNPPERGAEAPDWFYVPNVAPLVNGVMRRSYVMWKEVIAPLLAIEFVSGDGSEEHDRTAPFAEDAAKVGKFWVYEQAIRIPFYVIYDVQRVSVEVYELVANRYQRCEPNDRGHYPIAPMGIELGIWQGSVGHQTLPWLRVWDDMGYLLLSAEERAHHEQQRAEQEKQRANQEQQRADQEQQRADQEQQRADQEQQRAEQEQQRAEQEKQRAEQEQQRAEQEQQRADHEQQRADQEQQRAEQEKQRREQLEAFLRSQGLDLDQIPEM